MKKQKSLIIAVSVLVSLSNFSYAKNSHASVHSAGANIISNGTIYMITDNGQRRPYTSAGAFLSYGFNSWQTVVNASTEDMELPQGNFIPPRDGKIVCSDRSADKGTCYLIVDGKRAAFVSEKVFKDLGFNFSRAIAGDVSFLEKDADITDSGQQHRPGTLINKNGTIFLVASSGLLGIPSTEVLKTWGYSFDDTVPANQNDFQLQQSFVISNRQGGRLRPTESVLSGVSESSIIQGFLDSYPDLPIATTTSPQDAALVIDLVKKIQAISSNKFESFYPFLTKYSIELLTNTPIFKKYFETPNVQLTGLSIESTNIQIFEGGNVALYTENKKQVDTGYATTINWVCKKENGIWKWDFIGELKYEDKLRAQRNPGKVFTEGNGVSDIGIVDAEYLAGAAVNDPNTSFYIKLRNNGGTTIKQFKLLVRLNNVIVINDIYGYVIDPGKTVILLVPVSYYWELSSTNKEPGRYATDIKVLFDDYTVDHNLSNNSFNLVTIFDRPNSSLINLSPTN